MEKEDSSSNDSLFKILITKGFWLYFFGYLSAPLRYIIRLIISNSTEVSPSDIGILYSIISLVTILYTYNDLGLTGSLQYFLPKFKLKEKYDDIKFSIYLSLFVQIITGIFISIGLRFGSDRLANNYFHDGSASKLLKYFCFYFIGTNILQVIQSIFKSLQKTFEYKLTEFVKVFSIMIFSIVFLLIDLGNIEYYSIARVLGIFIAIIMGIILYKKYNKNLMQGKFSRNSNLFKKYTHYALRSFIGTNIIHISGQIILQIVIYFLGPEDAGYYSNFQSLFNIGTTLLGPIMLIICPITSELFEKSNKEKIQQLLSIFYNYFSIAILGLTIIFITLGPEIATVLFGEKYLTSGLLLSYSGIFLIFKQLGTFNYSVLSGIGKVKEKVFILAFTCILSFIISCILVKYWGIYGACIAFGLSLIFSWLVSLSIIRKKINFGINFHLLIKNIIILIILGGLIYIIKDYIHILSGGNRIFMGILVITITVLLYLIIAFINKTHIIQLLNDNR